MGFAAIAGIVIEALPYIAKGGAAVVDFIGAANEVYDKVKADGEGAVTQEDVDRMRSLYADLEMDFYEDDEL